MQVKLAQISLTNYKPSFMKTTLQHLVQYRIS